MKTLAVLSELQIRWYDAESNGCVRITCSDNIKFSTSFISSLSKKYYFCGAKNLLRRCKHSIHFKERGKGL